MKHLIEHWRQYLAERIDGGPGPDRGNDFDLGDTFATISMEDIVTGRYRKLSTIEQATVLAFLDQLAQVEKEKDPEKISRILRSISTMSGNSGDFTFGDKEEAMRAYKTPFKYKAHPKDHKLTKSLEDWHRHLNIVNSIDRPQRRKEAIEDFYTSSDYHHTIAAPRKTAAATKRDKPA
jgi:hypothetical protein|tara:strand:+ start:8694 stop:9227 length:534 start_codon:yes stop_codon:yes gene_type:complete